MGKPGDPAVVNRGLVETAIARAKGRGDAWSEYIRAHYQATGRLAPGCDAVDFYAAYDIAKAEGVGEVTAADLTALWKTVCDAHKQAAKSKFKGVWVQRWMQAQTYYEQANKRYEATAS